MANPIHCDIHNQDHLADVLVSQLGTGDTIAACIDGYLELCRAYVARADAQGEDALAEEEAMTRLLEVAANVPTESPGSSDEATASPGEPGRPADGPGDQEPTLAPPEPDEAVTGQPGRAGGKHRGDAIPA